jgi:TonB family protein
MRRLSGLLLLLASGTALHAAAPPLGEFVEDRGEQFLPQVGLTLHVPDGPQPGVYRQIALNWQDRPLQVGRYPAAAFAARRDGEVGVSLTIAADGKLSDCRVIHSSGDRELDNFSCAHLLAHTAYHPGLDESGTRFGGTVPATFRYMLRAIMEGPAAGGGAPAETVKPPAPAEGIKLATLGIAAGSKPPPNVWGIGATLAVEADGSVSACFLHSPTYVDAIDKQACDRLRALRFNPALDSQNRPVAGQYAFGLGWRG